jgi:lipoteichoic acid synthase
MSKELKTLFRSVLLFFCLIVYWELLLYAVAHGSLRGIKGWFLLFALPQAMLPAALCGWRRVKVRRSVTALLAFVIFAFYCAHLIYCRVFGSMISLSMMGVGGDAITEFWDAMMSTVMDSLGWLFMCVLPVLVLIAGIFAKGKDEDGVRPLLRLAALVLGFALWLTAGWALRLGGTGTTSAHYAFVSSLVDTDTAAARLGVMTTSTLEAKSMVFGGDETEAEALLDDSSAQEIILPTVPAEQVAQAPAEEQPPREEAPVLHVNPAIDFSALAASAPDEAAATLSNYFASISGSAHNEYTGLLEGYNLIYICAESFCSAVISEEVTPTLYRMANEGVVLTNFYNSFKNTTTNGEFALLTGLWPDVSRKADMGETNGSFGQSVRNYMPYGPGNIFRALGVDSFAYHNYYGTYYGRYKTHANLGYSCKFRGDMRFTDTWPASDLQMMEQSVDDYIGLDRFNVYYMTFSGHGPYNIKYNDICHRNFKYVPETVNGNKLTVHARCYLASNLEVERSMEYLLNRLEEAGKLNNTLIVLAGDHYPYYLTDEAAESILGELPEKDFEHYHSTCIMWCGGLDEPIVCDAPCCNVDILPTILNLLGIEYDSRMLSGTDVLSDDLHAAMLYNKSFITDKVKYNAATGEIIVTDESWAPTEEELQTYVDGISRILSARYAAALSVNKLDYYRYVWTASGLMPEEE